MRLPGRQIFRSSGELARAGGRRHNEHDVFVDRRAARLEATTCDDGYTHQHTAFQRTTAQWIRWAGQGDRSVLRWRISSCRPWHQRLWRCGERMIGRPRSTCMPPFIGTAQWGGGQKGGARSHTRTHARAAHGNCRAKRGVVVDLGVSFDGRPLCLYEVKTLHYSDAYTAPSATSGMYGVRHRQPHASAVDYRE
jgi:hypothetical protein